MALENLSPMIAIPFRERTLYVPQQSYGSETRTPDIMIKIEPEEGGTAITKSTLDAHEDFSEVKTFIYDIKRDIHSDASRYLHTNAQTFLSDVSFVMPAEPVLANIIHYLLTGKSISKISFREIQNVGNEAGAVQTREETVFSVCYFTHLQRFTTSWGGNSRINLIACAFRALEYHIKLDDVDQETQSPGSQSTEYNFGTSTVPGITG